MGPGLVLCDWDGEGAALGGTSGEEGRRPCGLHRFPLGEKEEEKSLWSQWPLRFGVESRPGFSA